MLGVRCIILLELAFELLVRIRVRIEGFVLETMVGIFIDCNIVIRPVDLGQVFVCVLRRSWLVAFDTNMAGLAATVRMSNVVCLTPKIVLVCLMWLDSTDWVADAGTVAGGIRIIGRTLGRMGSCMVSVCLGDELLSVELLTYVRAKLFTSAVVMPLGRFLTCAVRPSSVKLLNLGFATVRV